MDLQNFKRDLLARIDIVDVVERYVTLRKAGINYSACCPFHSEKTPSFTVSQSKQFYHCFGCGAHGNAIDFIMQYSGQEFMDALTELAQSAGMQLPRFSPGKPGEKERKQPLTEFMSAAMRFYREQLKQSPKAIEYLKNRGLTGEIAARFGLGYSPEEWQGLEKVVDNYNDPGLVECGLVIVNEQGRRYDRFRDRVMFPIQDQKGNIIGFGGRVIGQGEPKYLNSPETPLFEKGRELYGLPQARQAIRDEDTVIVVEGYMDVVALAQHGVGNAVATLGTATTAHHLHKLMRQASRIVFCFDGDKAGKKAAWRALEASLDQLSDDKTVGFLFLPPEHDPDSFVRSEGAEAFKRQVAHPTTLTEFLMRELTAQVDLTTAEGRARLIFEAKPLITRLAAPNLKLQLVKALADAAVLSSAEVEMQCDIKPAVRSGWGRTPAPARKSRNSARTMEHSLLEIVIQKPEWSVRLPLDLIPQNTEEGLLLHAIANAIEHGELSDSDHGLLLEFFRGHPQENLLAQLMGVMAREPLELSTLETVLNDAVEKIRMNHLRLEIDSRKSDLTPEEWLTLLAKKKRPSES